MTGSLVSLRFHFNFTLITFCLPQGRGVVKGGQKWFCAGYAVAMLDVLLVLRKLHSAKRPNTQSAGHLEVRQIHLLRHGVHLPTEAKISQLARARVLFGPFS